MVEGRGLEAAVPAARESAASVAAGRRARPALLQIGVRHWQSRSSHQAATTVVVADDAVALLLLLLLLMLLLLLLQRRC